jgi:hypothetical protein
MNHTRFPKEDHLPDWARRDNQVKKGDRVDHVSMFADQPLEVLSALFSASCSLVYLNTNTNTGPRALVHVTEGKNTIHAISFHRLSKTSSKKKKSERWIR